MESWSFAGRLATALLIMVVVLAVLKPEHICKKDIESFVIDNYRPYDESWYGIPLNFLGQCPSGYAKKKGACHKQCEKDNDCENGKCEDGICVVKTCPPGSYRNDAGECVKDCPPEATCESGKCVMVFENGVWTVSCKCPEGYIRLKNGECYKRCGEEGEECEDGTSCEEVIVNGVAVSVCVPKCKENEYLDDDGACRPLCDNGECPEGYGCIDVKLPDGNTESRCIPLKPETCQPPKILTDDGECLDECIDGECPDGYECKQVRSVQEDGSIVEKNACVVSECPEGETLTDDGRCAGPCPPEGVCPDGSKCQVVVVNGEPTLKCLGGGAKADNCQIWPKPTKRSTINNERVSFYESREPCTYQVLFKHPMNNRYDIEPALIKCIEDKACAGITVCAAGDEATGYSLASEDDPTLCRELPGHVTITKDGFGKCESTANEFKNIVAGTCVDPATIAGKIGMGSDGSMMFDGYSPCATEPLSFGWDIDPNNFVPNVPDTIRSDNIETCKGYCRTNAACEGVVFSNDTCRLFTTKPKHKQKGMIQSDPNVKTVFIRRKHDQSMVKLKDVFGNIGKSSPIIDSVESEGRSALRLWDTYGPGHYSETMAKDGLKPEVTYTITLQLAKADNDAKLKVMWKPDIVRDVAIKGVKYTPGDMFFKASTFNRLTFKSNKIVLPENAIWLERENGLTIPYHRFFPAPALQGTRVEVKNNGIDVSIVNRPPALTFCYGCVYISHSSKDIDVMTVVECIHLSGISVKRSGNGFKWWPTATEKDVKWKSSNNDKVLVKLTVPVFKGKYHVVLYAGGSEDSMTPICRVCDKSSIDDPIPKTPPSSYDLWNIDTSKETDNLVDTYPDVKTTRECATHCDTFVKGCNAFELNEEECRLYSLDEKSLEDRRWREEGAMLYHRNFNKGSGGLGDVELMKNIHESIKNRYPVPPKNIMFGNNTEKIGVSFEHSADENRVLVNNEKLWNVPKRRQSWDTIFHDEILFGANATLAPARKWQTREGTIMVYNIVINNVKLTCSNEFFDSSIGNSNYKREKKEFVLIDLKGERSRPPVTTYKCAIVNPHFMLALSSVNGSLQWESYKEGSISPSSVWYAYFRTPFAPIYNAEKIESNGMWLNPCIRTSKLTHNVLIDPDPEHCTEYGDRQLTIENVGGNKYRIRSKSSRARGQCLSRRENPGDQDIDALVCDGNKTKWEAVRHGDGTYSFKDEHGDYMTKEKHNNSSLYSRRWTGSSKQKWILPYGLPVKP